MIDVGNHAVLLQLFNQMHNQKNEQACLGALLTILISKLRILENSDKCVAESSTLLELLLQPRPISIAAVAMLGGGGGRAEERYSKQT